MRFRTITVRIAGTFRTVPEDIIRILSLILLAKIFRLRVDSGLRRQYRAYVEDHLLPAQPVRPRRISKKYTAAGRVYNLASVFKALNQRYFENKLPLPVLGWSLRKSVSRLGFYSRDRQLLVISRIFDNPKVPVHVIEYLVYHEMLHMYFPVEKRNGRTYIHTRAFREREKAFPAYNDANDWIKKHLRGLK
jgi:predicted metal-dependent hydrolase